MTKRELLNALEEYPNETQIIVHIYKKTRNANIRLFVYREVYNELVICFPKEQSAEYIEKKRGAWKAEIKKIIEIK